MRHFLLTSLAIVGLTSMNVQAAPIVAVDFGSNSFVQSGFTGFDGSSNPLTIGSFTVTTTGGTPFYRGGLTNSGSFTFANLYNDFAYVNTAPVAGAGGNSMAFAVNGLAANTPYSVTFYSYDPYPLDGSHTDTYSGQSGTTGVSAVGHFTAGAAVTSNNQFAATSVFTSNGAGTLSFLVSDSFTGVTDVASGVRFNGFSITALPEPSGLVLLLLGIVGAGSFCVYRGGARANLGGCKKWATVLKAHARG